MNLELTLKLHLKLMLTGSDFPQFSNIQIARSSAEEAKTCFQTMHFTKKILTEFFLTLEFNMSMLWRNQAPFSQFCKTGLPKYTFAMNECTKFYYHSNLIFLGPRRGNQFSAKLHSSQKYNSAVIEIKRKSLIRNSNIYTSSHIQLTILEKASLVLLLIPCSSTCCRIRLFFYQTGVTYLS